MQARDFLRALLTQTFMAQDLWGHNCSSTCSCWNITAHLRCSVPGATDNEATLEVHTVHLLFMSRELDTVGAVDLVKDNISIPEKQIPKQGVYQLHLLWLVTHLPFLLGSATERPGLISHGSWNSNSIINPPLLTHHLFSQNPIWIPHLAIQSLICCTWQISWLAFHPSLCVKLQKLAEQSFLLLLLSACQSLGWMLNGQSKGVSVMLEPQLFILFRAVTQDFAFWINYKDTEMVFLANTVAGILNACLHFHLNFGLQFTGESVKASRADSHACISQFCAEVLSILIAKTLYITVLSFAVIEKGQPNAKLIGEVCVCWNTWQFSSSPQLYQ